MPQSDSNASTLVLPQQLDSLNLMVRKTNDPRADFPLLCKHEAGHHVVARMCGFKVGSISLEVGYRRRYGYAEVILAGTVDSLAKVEGYLEDRVKVLYAGAAAEALRSNKVDTKHAIEILRNSGGESDWVRARDCIQLLRNVSHPQTLEFGEIQRELDALDQKLWSETVEMVERSASVIERLAGMMELRIDLDTPVSISIEDIEGVEGIKGLG